MKSKVIRKLLACTLASSMLLGMTVIAGAAEGDGWREEDGKLYWYENGVRQGYDPENPAYRGKEIYDPGSNQWYWLDNVQQGAKTVNKEVYQDSLAGPWGAEVNENGERIGKWVRYDGEGHMIKGWYTCEAGTYYYDLTYGTMARGSVEIDGKQYRFNEFTGILEEGELLNGWVAIDGKEYWYENNVRQGYDPNNPAYRGKEIYDPGSNQWYWLDNVQQGAKTVNKDVYQESQADENGTIGKWVRYNGEGHMVKGWDTNGNGTYYFDPVYGTMTKGFRLIDGNLYFFDRDLGTRYQSCRKTIDGTTYDFDAEGKATVVEQANFKTSRSLEYWTEDKDGKVTSRTVYEYDENITGYNYSDPVKELHYGEDGKLSYSYEYTYDDKGNTLTQVEKDAQGNIVYRYTNKYNEKGTRISQIQEGYTDTGKLSYKYEYTYNDKGNTTWYRYERYSEGELYSWYEYTYEYNDFGKTAKHVYKNSDVTGEDKTYSITDYSYDDQKRCIKAVTKYPDYLNQYVTYSYFNDTTNVKTKILGSVTKEGVTRENYKDEYTYEEIAGRTVKTYKGYFSNVAADTEKTEWKATSYKYEWEYNQYGYETREKKYDYSNYEEFAMSSEYEYGYYIPENYKEGSYLSKNSSDYYRYSDGNKNYSSGWHWFYRSRNEFDRFGDVEELVYNIDEYYTGKDTNGDGIKEKVLEHYNYYFDSNINWDLLNQVQQYKSYEYRNAAKEVKETGYRKVQVISVPKAYNAVGQSQEGEMEAMEKLKEGELAEYQLFNEETLAESFQFAE